MTEQTFKVGDKVKVKDFVEEYSKLEGRITVIIKKALYPYMVKFSKTDGENVFNDDELELINEGKIFIFRK